MEIPIQLKSSEKPNNSITFFFSFTLQKLILVKEPYSWCHLKISGASLQLDSFLS